MDRSLPDSSVHGRLPFPSLGDLSTPGIEPGLPHGRQLKSGMKVIFQTLDKLFIASKYKITTLHTTVFQLFSGTSKTSFQPISPDYSLPNAFCGTIFKLLH